MFIDLKSKCSLLQNRKENLLSKKKGKYSLFMRGLHFNISITDMYGGYAM